MLLDEIGELPLELQVKLLRVLQEREVRPLGANINIKINVRVLAATAKNLNEEVEQGHFRQDLFFRLNVVELKIPALRERPEDIPLLVHSFIATESRKMNIRHKRDYPRLLLALLSSYSWPGNVRELKNVLEHAIIFAENGWISSESSAGKDLQARTLAIGKYFYRISSQLKKERFLLRVTLLPRPWRKPMAISRRPQSFWKSAILPC